MILQLNIHHNGQSQQARIFLNLIYILYILVTTDTNRFSSTLMQLAKTKSLRSREYNLLSYGIDTMLHLIEHNRRKGPLMLGLCFMVLVRLRHNLYMTVNKGLTFVLLKLECGELEIILLKTLHILMDMLTLINRESIKCFMLGYK